MSKKYIRKYPDAKYSSPVGAPKGGRVHWFLLKLDRVIARKYMLEYDYSKHAYILKLKDCRRRRMDMYFICRTSSNCWKVMYYDEPTCFIEPTSYKKPDDVIDYILYRMQKKIQQENFYEEELQVKQRKKTEALVNGNIVK